MFKREESDLNLIEKKELCELIKKTIGLIGMSQKLQIKYQTMSGKLNGYMTLFKDEEIIIKQALENFNNGVK